MESAKGLAERNMAMGVGPTFPVIRCLKVIRGWPWSKRDVLTKETYTDLESLANDLEMIDTRGDLHDWIIDSNGKEWDVKLDILNGKLSDTEFFPRN